MRFSLFAALLCAALAFAPTAHAQSDSDDAMMWYVVKVGDRTETVRAKAIQVQTRDGRRTVKADRQRYAADEEVIIVLIPTEDDDAPPMDLVRSALRGKSPWIFHQPPVSARNGSSTTTTTSTSPDGKYETTTTTTSTPSSDGSPPTTTSSTTIRGTGK